MTAPAVATAAPTGARPSARRQLAAWLAGISLAGVTLVLACRALNTDAVTPVPQLLAFLPWLLLPAGTALLLAALARWRVGMAWGAVAVAVTAWFMQPYGAADTPSAPPVAHLRVLTSNVEFGQATEELLATIRRERPDLVFVQECDLGCGKALRDRADYPHHHIVQATGAEGSAILSRYPLKTAEGVPGTLSMPGAVVEIEGHQVRLQLAHPMPPMPGDLGIWRSELAALRDYAARDGRTPTILAGDFNASQDHAAFRRILDTGLRDSTRLAGGSRTPSWPSASAPPLGAQIDHVLVSKDFSARATRFLDLPNTDHRSLLADLTLHTPHATLHTPHAPKA
ncbi:endonuclease/exonuclease/phosphatase family protein [Streptomyces sp. E11-3]